MNGPPRHWLHYFVHVQLGPETASEQYRLGIMVLRRLETWLSDHHRPRQLFDRHGRPKSPMVSVFFSAAEAQTAMAYRMFCNELGLSHALQQSRIHHNCCPRTMPLS